MRFVFGGSVLGSIVLVLALAAATRLATSPATAREIPPAPRAELKRSSVPVLVPSQLLAGAPRSAVLTVISAGSDGYYIGFSAARGCGGAAACSDVHVAGYPRNSLAGRAFGHDRRVRLPDRAVGFYSPPDCLGTHCTEASLTFERFGAVYELDAKRGTGGLALLFDIYRQLRRVDPPPHRGR